MNQKINYAVSSEGDVKYVGQSPMKAISQIFLLKNVDIEYSDRLSKLMFYDILLKSKRLN